MDPRGLPPSAPLPAIAKLLFDVCDAADESPALANAIGLALIRLLGWPKPARDAGAFPSRARDVLMALEATELIRLGAKLQRATATDPVQQVAGLLLASWITCLGLSLQESPCANYAIHLSTQCERALACLVELIHLERRVGAGSEAPQAAAA